MIIKQNKNKMSMNEMDGGCGKNKKDRIKNEYILSRVSVANIKEKMRERCLRWFHHAQQKLLNVPLRRIEMMGVTGV